MKRRSIGLCTRRCLDLIVSGDRSPAAFSCNTQRSMGVWTCRWKCLGFRIRWNSLQGCLEVDPIAAQFLLGWTFSLNYLPLPQTIRNTALDGLCLFWMMLFSQELPLWVARLTSSSPPIEGVCHSPMIFKLWEVLLRWKSAMHWFFLWCRWEVLFWLYGVCLITQAPSSSDDRLILPVSILRIPR